MMCEQNASCGYMFCMCIARRPEKLMPFPYFTRHLKLGNLMNFYNYISAVKRCGLWCDDTVSCNVVGGFGCFAILHKVE